MTNHSMSHAAMMSPNVAHLYLSLVRGCGSSLHRKRVGSRMQPLSDCMSIFARRQHWRPRSDPFSISLHSSRFSSTAGGGEREERREEGGEERRDEEGGRRTEG